MTYRRHFIVCLLFALPHVVHGQAFSSSFFDELTQILDNKENKIEKKEGVGWLEAITQGGMVRSHAPLSPMQKQMTQFLGRSVPRTGPWYIRIPNGLGNLLSANYVDGYTVGPHATFGYVNAQGGRIEIEEHIRWAFSRNVLLANGAISYIFPPERRTEVSVFGGKTTIGFDADPVLEQSQSLLASGLFGWNKEKLYEQTAVGVRGRTALTKDVEVDGQLMWERREQMFNHRKRNIFGVSSKDNIPYVDGRPEQMFAPEELVRVELGAKWQKGSTLHVIDDMTSRVVSSEPAWGLKMTSGIGEGLRYLSFEANVEQQMILTWTDEDYRTLHYFAAAGFFANRDRMLLMDYRHFDSSKFPWLTRNVVTHFSLLNDYERSTNRHWVEVHADYMDINLLFSRWVDGFSLGEYVQTHFLVTERRTHTEFSYGFDFESKFRLGFSIGLNDLKWDGIGLNLVLDI